MEVERTGYRPLILFRAEFKLTGQPVNPLWRVRVWQGLDKPNPYPYPRPTRGTYPRVFQTRANPYRSLRDRTKFWQILTRSGIILRVSVNLNGRSVIKRRLWRELPRKPRDHLLLVGAYLLHKARTGPSSSPLSECCNYFNRTK
jgi:hypothetical protein